MLAASLETFEIPDDLLVICIGKSTYARVGVFPNITGLEASWRGVLTMEIANLGASPVYIYPNEGIAQLVFFRGNDPASPYEGPYQDQKGVQEALVGRDRKIAHNTSGE